MNVVDHEEHMWILFRYEDKLLFDANCNHHVFGYSWLIELKPHEVEAYQKRGREYLHELAEAIQNMAPIARGSTSQYKSRDLTKQLGELTTKVFLDWKAKRDDQLA